MDTIEHKLAVAYHPAFLSHDTGPDHPERPERLSAVIEALKTAPWAGKIEWVEPREIPLEYLARVHDAKYIDAIRRLCEAGGEFLASMEANIGEESWEAALRAAGAGVTLAEGILEGRWKVGFAAVRPPGHHAVFDRPKGFCIFNNIAVAARYLQFRGIGRVGIIDFDVHHGNGTETAFYEDDSVFFCSLHRDNLFPFDRGRATDRGRGRGEGYTLNIPLPAASDDQRYLEAFDKQVIPALETFKPEFILVSAGFDAHIRDMLGGMRMTAAGYVGIGERIRKLADAHAQGRVVTFLEGGYDLVGLKEGVTAYFGGILGL